jgi:YHS domain-containing protein
MAAVLLALLLGCPAPVVPVGVAPGLPSAFRVEGAPPPFVNDDGQVACAVMGDVVAAPSKAAGFRDHAGRRYWFCCDSCAHLFDDAPERYADGSYLREIGKAHGNAEPPACEEAR